MRLCLQGYIPGGQNTLVRGYDDIIMFDGFIVHLFFRDRLEDRLEEVGVEPQDFVDSL
jgi:hypothetical protein